MEHRAVTEESCNIIGIELQTNAIESGAKLAKLWHKFVAENIQNKIPNKAHIYPVVVYYNYSDKAPACAEPVPGIVGKKQYYSCLLGYKTTSLDDIPVGMTGVIVPTQTYALVHVSGDFPESLQKAWEAINHSDLKRTYTFDLESYKHFQEPNHPIDIYIAIQQ